MSNDFEMNDSTYRFVKLFFAILSFSKISHGLTFEKRLCENSTANLTCPGGNAIGDINIMFNDIGNACSLTNDSYIEPEAMNSASYLSCIGHNSCVITDQMINVSHLVADKTWKLNIDFHCIRTDQFQKNNSKPEIAVCPYNMESVRCERRLNKIEIQSVEVMQYSSFYENHNLDPHCTELIKHNVIESCNINNTCQPIIWTTSVNTWDDCIRIPKFVKISFSCKAITTERPSQDETSEHGSMGIVVGVIVGLIIIVGVVVLYLLIVRRKNTDDKHDIAHVVASNHEHADYVQNQNVALPAQCNSEKNLELRIIDRKQANKNETILETGFRKDIDNPYYNLANYSTALDTTGTGLPVQRSNVNNYELAKPINDSIKYEQNTTMLEKNKCTFNEDQYDIAGKMDVSDYQQGIYSRSVDTVYDSASHSRQTTVTDETYDHTFGPTTEDDYHIAKH